MTVAHLQAMLDAPEPVEALFAPVTHGHFTFTPSGLLVDEADGGPQYEEWANVGNVLGVMERGINFLVGDWIRYGEGRYGEAAAQIIDARQWKPETVRNAVWVSQKVAREDRMIDRGLHVKHHVVVAKLPAEEQRRWLRKAIAGDGGGERWSASRLKAEVKAEAANAELVVTAWHIVATCLTELERDRVLRLLEHEGVPCKTSESRSLVASTRSSIP